MSASTVPAAALEIARRIGFLQTLGIQLAEVGDRHAVMRVTIDDRHRNAMGGAHGGLLATLVDTVAFFPRPLLPSGRSLTTTQLAVSYIRPSQVGDVLSSRAELLHVGRRTASVAVQVTDQDGKLVAHGTVGLMFFDEAGAPLSG